MGTIASSTCPLSQDECVFHPGLRVGQTGWVALRPHSADRWAEVVVSSEICSVGPARRSLGMASKHPHEMGDCRVAASSAIREQASVSAGGAQGLFGGSRQCPTGAVALWVSMALL